MKYLLFCLILFIFLLFADTANADSRLDNCLIYKDQIISILKSESLSEDYFYLAVCESGCKVKTSSKGARSFFQVTPFIYRHYKSDECSNEDIDDLKCNTIAAARYLKHLEETFKDIKTTVKAYNRGGKNLKRYGTTKEADSLSYCVLNYIKNFS